MSSTLPAVFNCMTTGATAVTWFTFRRRSATFIDTGAPVTPVIKDEPGGETITSAPMPFWRSAESFMIPTDKPTIKRIRVTSTAIATMLMTERNGRCTRLEMTILFIGMIVTDGAAAQRIGYSAAQQSKLEERRERIAPATAGSVQRYEGASRRCRLRKMAGE